MPTSSSRPGDYMSVYLYCRKCHSTSSTKNLNCSKCETPFPKENRKYRVSVTVKGETVTRTFDNITLAKKAESTIKSDLLRGEFNINNHKVKTVTTLDDVWSRYLPWAKDNKSSWKDDYYHYNKHLKPRFGNKPLEEISAIDIENFIKELRNSSNARGTDFKPATIKHQIVLLRRLFNIAIKWDMFQQVNPVNRVSIPKIDNQVTEFMTTEQSESLLNTLESWPCKESAAFVKFAFYTGLRRGELFKLKWSDVDLERMFVTLRNPKGGKTITLPISEEAVEVLSALPCQGEYVFPGKGGKQRVDFKGPWGRIRKAAGLPDDFRLHGLRHNYASHLVSNGVGLEVVKELMTHKDMITTQRYAHLLPGAMKEAVEKSGKILKPKS